MDSHAQLRADSNAMKAEFSQLIQDLTAEIQNLRIQLEAKSTHPPKPSSVTKRPRPSLSDPNKFTGTVSRFDIWDTVIRAKLAIDGAAIGDSQAQFHYVFNRLSSQVQKRLEPQLIAAYQTDEFNFEAILDKLTSVYGNPNNVEEAKDRLFSIRQNPSHSVAVYISRFEQLLSKAKGQDWCDGIKIAILRQGLDLTILVRLYEQSNQPRVYSDFVKLIQQLDT